MARQSCATEAFFAHPAGAVQEGSHHHDYVIQTSDLSNVVHCNQPCAQQHGALCPAVEKTNPLNWKLGHERLL
eukprot:scaffold4761_cov21-Tisochrysis_lutea.AAC.1